MLNAHYVDLRTNPDLKYLGMDKEVLEIICMEGQFRVQLCQSKGKKDQALTVHEPHTRWHTIRKQPGK